MPAIEDDSTTVGQVSAGSYDAALTPTATFKGKRVTYCHQHNLVEPESAGAERKYGIRVSLPAGDTFSSVLGESWETLHWYRNEAERDAAYERMAVRHGYYRKTDSPTQVLEKIAR